MGIALIKRKKYLYRIFLIALLLAELFIGFYISTFQAFNSAPIVLIAGYFLIALSLLIGRALCAKNNGAADLPPRSDGERDIEHDYYLLYTKNLNDPIAKRGIKIGFSLICITTVYICVLAVVIYANVVCKRVSNTSIAVVCVLSFLALILNKVQIVLTSDKILWNTALQNGLPALGLVGYMVVEWLILPVTFNFILCFSLMLLMIPVHLKFGWLSREFYKIYKK